MINFIQPTGLNQITSDLQEYKRIKRLRLFSHFLDQLFVSLWWWNYKTEMSDFSLNGNH